MTNDDIHRAVLKYRGSPFLCGEFASDIGVTWHRMKRLLDKMVSAGEVVKYEQWGDTFYSPRE